MPAVLKRVEAVRRGRIDSHPTGDAEPGGDTLIIWRNPSADESQYLAIPKTSSESRAYIPMAFLKPTIIANTELFAIGGASNFQFGVLSSAMHMAWVRSVCGRLKSDYRYSAGIVYNNFPWPEAATAKQRKTIEDAAQAVLDARAKYPQSSLADLYDPLTMPADLVKAHRKLDAAVDAAYSKRKFAGDRDRVAFLFEAYGRLISPLEVAKPKRKKAVA